MAYTTNLRGNWQLTIASKGNQTFITLVTSSPGQQQSQGFGVTTGNWTKPPQLFQTAASFILQIDSETGQHFVDIQASGIQTLTTAPFLNNAQTIELHQIEENTIELEPMPPMQMGNMSMNMNPMSMRMGNMSMTMGESFQSAPTKRFCTQCGQAAKPPDRFCSNCGHKL
jgi:hypothetical protein